jgi:hypothetical protein
MVILGASQRSDCSWRSSKILLSILFVNLGIDDALVWIAVITLALAACNNIKELLRRIPFLAIQMV